jgi:predicted DNA-binding transcriptional regulator AlpA
MTPSAYERLRQLVGEPSPESLPTWIGACEQVKAELLARLMGGQQSGSAQPREDRLLTVEEAAEKLGVKVGWLYRNADRLPFTVRPSPGLVRFSLLGIEKWLTQQRGRVTS